MLKLIRLFIGLISSLFIAGTLSLHAQEVYLQGYVEDQLNNERLLGVNVVFPDLGISAYSNPYGFFQQKLPKGKWSCIIRLAGYKSQSLEIVLEKDSTITIKLERLDRNLAEVEIVAESGITAGQLGKLGLSQEKIREIPLIGGEADAIKALQLLPGIQGGNEGSSGLYVRGGSPDQNLILLDGVPVYNTAHAFGLFSIFNPTAVKDISLYKGAIPAQYGERLSSVVDIRLKEGNRKYREGKLELGLISLKGMFEGPIGKKDEQGEAATSFLISGRRTFLDLFSRPAQWLSKSENRSGFSFYDLTAKINHRFEAGNEIFISFYTGNDALNLGSIDRIETDSSSLTDRLIQKLDWGNETAMIRWNKLWSKRVFSNLSVYYSRYKLGADLRKRRRIRFNGQTTENTNGSIFSSRLRELGVRWGNSWKFARQHHLRAGLQGQRYHFSPSATQFIIQEDQLLKGDSVLSAPIQSLWTGAAYVEDIFQLSQKVAGHLGFRYSAINTGSNFSSYIQTRAKLSWQIHDKLHMFLGYTENVQFLHLLSNAELPLPVDLWVPSTEKVKPALSKQVSAGWAGNFGKGTWAWQVESYYKKQSHLIAYTEGANFFDEDPSPTNLAPSTDWENEVETNGEGLSYGAELLLERNQGRLSGWISYTLGWTWRQFEGINDGKRYPFIFDRRHNLNISTGFQLSERSSIHANWIIQSGRRTSLPLGEFISIYGNSVLLYGERNNHQFPLYHRMDLAYSNRKEKPYGQRVWRIGAYNAYSRLNAYSVSVETFQGEVFLSSNSLFPIIPYLSIEWVFDKF